MPTARCSWWCHPKARAAKTRHWKTGFYFIALQAQVPIVLAFVDYRRKVAGLGPEFKPTGDVEQDMAQIKQFLRWRDGAQRPPVRSPVATPATAAERHCMAARVS